MSKRIVIALGGNALGNTPYEQLALVTETAKPIVDLIAQGNEVIIAHGNGPQVGMINLGMATAAEAKAIKSDMPFPECGAMSQGYIGYHLQNAIGNELASRGMNKDVATVVTQVLVDEADPAFQHPTKPVGAFYDKETADRIAAEKGYTMVEDAGRGYRQVVPSPKPIDVIEKNTVKALVDNGTVVITVGGGGIPVVRKDGKLYGTPAVIDKDFASAKLAELLDADMLVILTAVEKVAINFGKPDQKGLDTLTPDEARKYIDEKQFAPGSMLPKVQAAMSLPRASPAASRSSRCLKRQPRASRARPAPACRCKSRQTFLKRVRFKKRALFFALSPLWTKIHAAFLVKFDPHFFFFLLLNFSFLCIMVITVFKSFDCRKI
jgi:carbamate kinase